MRNDMNGRKKEKEEFLQKEKGYKNVPFRGITIRNVLITGLCLYVFVFFQLPLSQSDDTKLHVLSTRDKGYNEIVIPERSNVKVNNLVSNKNSNAGFMNVAFYDNENTTDIPYNQSESAWLNTTQAKRTQLNNYSGKNIKTTTQKVEVGNGSNKVTYFVSNITISDAKYLKTALATGKYGNNLTEEALKMAKDNKAVLAVSGDYYGFRSNGIVIRNGVLYRSTLSDTDILVLFSDGTMKAYKPEGFDAKKALEQGAWQAWNFGPAFLDGNGNILPTFNTITYLNQKHPRCAVGYAGANQFVFVVVDGRQNGYSRGLTLSELAQVMKNEGCLQAYNMDGGMSASMVFQNQYVNQRASGGRTISDIIYVAE